MNESSLQVVDSTQTGSNLRPLRFAFISMGPTEEEEDKFVAMIRSCVTPLESKNIERCMRDGCRLMGSGEEVRARIEDR